MKNNCVKSALRWSTCIINSLTSGRGAGTDTSLCLWRDDFFFFFFFGGDGFTEDRSVDFHEQMCKLPSVFLK